MGICATSALSVAATDFCSRIASPDPEKITEARQQLDNLTKNNLLRRRGEDRPFILGRGIIEYNEFNPGDTSPSRPMTPEEFDLVATLTPSQTYDLLHGETDHFEALKSVHSLPNPGMTEGQRGLIYDYITDLVRLKGTAHVIDLGAGELVQMAEVMSVDPVKKSGYPSELQSFFKRPLTDRPRATGITINPSEAGYRRKMEIENTGRGRVFVERKFEDISENEIIQDYGPADIVIDKVGVFRYSADLPLVTDKVSRLMKPGARLYAENGGALFIVDGKIYTLPEFLELTGLFNRVGIPMKNTDPYVTHLRTRFTASRDSVFVRRNTPPLKSLKYELVNLGLNPNGGAVSTYKVHFQTWDQKENHLPH